MAASVQEAEVRGARTAASVPRVVLVRRASEYEELVARHGTRGQARFFLETRGQELDPLDERHRRLEEGRRETLTAVPVRWRRSEVLRSDLDRFLFEPGDVVLVLGQDGLVANVAKYLSGQPVIGLNPDPSRNEGVLVRHPPDAAADLLADAAAGRLRLEERTMAEARLDDGQRLLALNEVFLGHRSHQSARYRIVAGGGAEHQSSSGVVVTTGTGATGWGRSINAARRAPLDLPRATDPELAFFVREAWASVATGSSIAEGMLAPGAPLELVSEMNEGGVIFGDGVEADHLAFPWGATATVAPADERLRLVVG